MQPSEEENSVARLTGSSNSKVILLSRCTDALCKGFRCQREARTGQNLPHHPLRIKSDVTSALTLALCALSLPLSSSLLFGHCARNSCGFTVCSFLTVLRVHRSLSISACNSCDPRVPSPPLSLSLSPCALATLSFFCLCDPVSLFSRAKKPQTTPQATPQRTR